MQRRVKVFLWAPTTRSKIGSPVVEVLGAKQNVFTSTTTVVVGSGGFFVCESA